MHSVGIVTQICSLCILLTCFSTGPSVLVVFADYTNRLLCKIGAYTQKNYVGKTNSEHRKIFS